MRCPIVDLKGPRTASNIYTKRLPRKRRLKYSLSKITCEEESIRLPTSQGCQKTELRDTYILCFIDYNEVERWVAALLKFATSRLNICSCVISPCSCKLHFTSSKTFHSMTRFCSGRRVFRPNRLTSRYSSQVCNCQASPRHAFTDQKLWIDFEFWYSLTLLR